MGAPGAVSVAPTPLSPVALASWRRRFVTTLACKYLAADLPPAERAEALQAIENLLKSCSPEALPRKAAVQAALAGPLAPSRERCRRAAEEERRELAYRFLNERLPTDMPREDFPRTDEAMELLLAGRPDDTAEDIAMEVLAPLHLASRRRRARKDYMESARRDIESGWEAAVILRSEEECLALRSHWVRTLEEKDQARIDFLKGLAREERLLPYGGTLARLVEERLAALLAEILPK